MHDLAELDALQDGEHDRDADEGRAFEMRDSIKRDEQEWRGK